MVDCSFTAIDCQALPPVELTIGLGNETRVISIPAEKYLVGSSPTSGSSIYTFAFQPGNSFGQSTWLLGDAMLSTQYLIFDAEK